VKKIFYSSIFILILTIFSSCLTYSPHATNIDYSDSARGVIKIYKPYYQKHTTAFGVFGNVIFAVGGAAGGAVVGEEYSNNESEKIAKQIGFGLTGFFGGHLIYQGLLGIGGHNKSKYPPSNAYINWFPKYLKKTKRNWIYVTDSLSSTDTIIYAFKPSAKRNFYANNIDELNYYFKTFPTSTYTNKVIVSANSKLSKNDLVYLADRFGDNPVILSSKTEYVNRSFDENDFFLAFKKYPETKDFVEKKYASIVTNLGSAKKFIETYPKSTLADTIFSKLVPKVNHKELDTLIDTYEKLTSKKLLKKATYLYFEQCETVDDLIPALKKHVDVEYCVSPDFEIENYDSSYALYTRLRDYKPVNADNNFNKFLKDLKLQTVKGQHNTSSGNIEQMKTLEKTTDADWLKDAATTDAIDKIKLENAKTTNEDIFTGTKVNGKPEGAGDLYCTNGSKMQGIFTEGKLNGKGRVIKSDGEIDEGNFVNGDMLGEGKIIYPGGIIYEGNFDGDNLSGHGKITNPDGSWSEGEFKTNKLNGIGEKQYKDGSFYKGGFARGKYNGFGKFAFKGEKKWFEGQFENGVRNGKGIFRFENQTEISGNWKDDCPEGEILIDKPSSTEGGLDNYKAKWTIKDCKTTQQDVLEGIDFSEEDKVFEKLPQR